MNRTIISLTILAVSAATSAATVTTTAVTAPRRWPPRRREPSSWWRLRRRGWHALRNAAVPVQPALNLSQIWLQTAVQCEQARRLYVANTALAEQYARALKEKRVQTSSARRDAERQKRLARQRQRQSDQAAVATEQRAEQGDKFGSTSVLSADGKIAWPTLLCDDQYMAQRDVFEAVLAKRAAAPSAGLDRDDLRQVELSCKELLAKLTTHARDANPNDWIAAKRFVESVAAEAGR